MPSLRRLSVVLALALCAPLSANAIEFSAQELARDHAAMPHGGFVIRSGSSSDGLRHSIEYRLQLDSNPEFTASVLVAYARAVHRLQQSGQTGCRTVFDVAPGLLSPKTAQQLRAELL